MSRRTAANMVTGLTVVGLLALACGGGSTRSAGASPQAGSVAPGFSLPSAQGATVSLAGFHGRKPVLLYFSMGPG
jgi:hypothetical protein